MGWFSSLLRRPRGRHALGAAVTSVPSAPLRLVSPAATVPAPTVSAPAMLATTVPAPVRSPEATVATLPLVPVSRVQLGFRDGSTASLAAGSEQAVALEALAGMLNRRSS